LAENNESGAASQELVRNMEQLKKRLDMLDQRLDNIDSIVSAVAERVMQRPITFNVTCSKCGQNIEIALIGIEKPRK